MATLTTIHVLISLVGLATGAIVTAGLLSSRRLDGWTSVFLWSTLATSVTGFFFPFERLLPSHVIGALSIVILGAALYARYAGLMAGVWRATYVVTAVAAFYLNVFVFVVQAFLKVPALNAMAPTQSEPPFAVAQLLVLAIFVVLGTRAVARFRPVPDAARSFTAV
jgi:hypothetical protein